MPKAGDGAGIGPQAAPYGRERAGAAEDAPAMTDSPSLQVAFSASLRASVALLVLAVAMLTASGWLGELVVGFSSVQGIPWASGLSNVMVAAVYLGCILGHARAERAWRAVSARRVSRALVCMGIAAALGRALSCLGGAWGLPAAAIGVGHAFYEACDAVLLMSALCAACGAVARWACIVFPAGYALAALLHFVLRAMPAVAVAGIAPMLPLVAGISLAWVARRDIGAHIGAASHVGPASKSGPVPMPAPGMPCDSSEEPRRPGGSPCCEEAPSSRWTFPVRPVILMCAYAFAFYFSLSLSEGPNPYGMLGMLLISLLALAVAVGMPSRYNVGFLYKTALPLMVAGLVCLAFLGEGRTVAVLFANSGNVAFTLFIYIALAGVCARYGVSPAWMFGIVQLSSEISGLVGMAAGREFTAAFPAGSPEANLAMCAMVVGVVVVSTVVFNDSVVARSFGMVPVDRGARDGDQAVLRGPAAAMSYSERVVWRCGQIARRYSLTLREQEVLELMVQGVSIPAIAERASISYGTAKTHVNHIYKKLDVHSRDEALALVSREVG